MMVNDGGVNTMVLPVGLTVKSSVYDSGMYLAHAGIPCLTYHDTFNTREVRRLCCHAISFL